MMNIGENVQNFTDNNLISVIDGNITIDEEVVKPRYWTRLQQKLLSKGLLKIAVGVNMNGISTMLSEMRCEIPGIEHYTNNRLRTTMALTIKIVNNSFEISGYIRDLYSFFSNSMGLDFLRALWLDHVDEVESEKEVKRLSIDEYKSIGEIVDSKNLLGNCSICCDQFPNKKCIKTKCGHIYHDDCLKNWLTNMCQQPTCPLCRSDLST